MIAVVDVDDTWNEDQIIRWLVPLKEQVPGLVVTSYTIPNKMGPVHELKKKYPWILFAIHGFEHSHFECLEWTRDKAAHLLRKAQEMGYERLFKPPNWRYDKELGIACAALGVVLHHHPLDHDPTYIGSCFGEKSADFVSLHTHIEENPATDFIGSHRDFRPERLQRFAEFKTPLDFASTPKVPPTGSSNGGSA